MIYKVKYGEHFLRRGGLGPIGTWYAHPSQVRAAVVGFERRHPDQKGKGLVECINKRKLVATYVPIF